MDKTWKVVGAFVVIFIAGTVTGALIALRVVTVVRTPFRSPELDQFGRMQLQLLVDRLDLTDEQRDKIRPIVQKAGADLRQLSRDSQRETRDIITRMHSQVSALLTPDQKEELARMVTRMQRRMNWQGGGAGGRPPGPGFRQKAPRPPPDAPGGSDAPSAPAAPAGAK